MGDSRMSACAKGRQSASQQGVIKKKAATLLHVEAEVCVFGRMGDDASPALRSHGAHTSHCVSIFRDVSASTKMLLQRQQSRRRGCVRPAALPCPPYAPLSWAAVVGRRTGGEEMLVMRPLRLSSPALLLRWKGTPSPTQKQWITRNGFYAAKFWHPQKRKPRRPYIGGAKGRCFAALSWGTGRSAASHAGDYTTARCRHCVVQRENLWFSTFCTFSSEPKQKVWKRSAL
jgi:hypothetical protein